MLLNVNFNNCTIFPSDYSDRVIKQKTVLNGQACLTNPDPYLFIAVGFITDDNMPAMKIAELWLDAHRVGVLITPKDVFLSPNSKIELSGLHNNHLLNDTYVEVLNKEFSNSKIEIVPTRILIEGGYLSGTYRNQVVNLYKEDICVHEDPVECKLGMVCDTLQILVNYRDENCAVKAINDILTLMGVSDATPFDIFKHGKSEKPIYIDTHDENK